MMNRLARSSIRNLGRVSVKHLMDLDLVKRNEQITESDLILSDFGEELKIDFASKYSCANLV